MPPKPTVDLNDSSNRVIAAIIIGLIFIGGWWLIARNASTAGVASDAEKQGAAQDTLQKGTLTSSSDAAQSSVLGPLSDDTPTITGSRESIDVVDQSAGVSVKVKEATFVQMGWIAVRDSSGRTLGAGRFEPGAHVDVEIPLLRATIAGERYQVLIYVDDGDKLFDLHKDILITSADGSVAGDVFSAQ